MKPFVILFLVFLEFFAIKQDNVIVLDAVSQNPKLYMKTFDYHYTKPEKSKFITGYIMVYNNGGAALAVNKIVPSCDCSRATLQKNPIPAMDSAKIYLQINLDGFYDDKNIVFFDIISSDSASPHRIRAFVDDVNVNNELNK